MRIALVSTYELGRQPFGIASPCAWLKRAGHQVATIDLSAQALDADVIRSADLIAICVPMHTATRVAAAIIPKLRELNPSAHLCCYGLYAPLNEDYLRTLGAGSVIGGEFEPALVDLANRIGGGEPAVAPSGRVLLDRLQFITPDRVSLPPLKRYAHLRRNGERIETGYTEASRGCRHLCRHCPVVPVYNGTFRVVQSEVVLADVRQQVAAGARHITFGDPDFLNGPGHARRIVEALHREFPALTWDATVKIEHLRRHRHLLPLFRDKGCLFVTTAVEALDDSVLEKLDKGHTRQDFLDVVRDFRETGLHLAPTFIPFTPWTTAESYRDLLDTIESLDLIENVSPVQFALRLLIPAGSRLLELADIQRVIDGYDQPALLWRWRHEDAAMDELTRDAMKIAAEGQKRKASRSEIFGELQERAGCRRIEDPDRPARTTIPYMEEPWYC